MEKIGNGATGDVEIRTIMEEIEETTLDEEGERQATNTEHNYRWQQAGVGVPYSALQGRKYNDSAFKVSVDGILE